jgi:hypothetical protein
MLTPFARRAIMGRSVAAAADADAAAAAGEYVINMRPAAAGGDRAAEAEGEAAGPA